MSSLWLSVVIPSYNESGRIDRTLDLVLDYLRRRQQPFELIVVDDGSTDGTADRVERRAEPEVRVMRLERNQGKGAAARCGVEASRGDYVLLTDADLSAPIEQLDRLEAALAAGYALACGSRGLPDSEILIRQPWYRELMGKIFNRLVRWLALSDFRDTQCGFKLFRAGAARDIFSRSSVDGFAFDVESLYLASKLGYPAVELPVPWRHVPESRVHAVKDSSRMLWDLIRIRLCTGRRV